MASVCLAGVEGWNRRRNKLGGEGRKASEGFEQPSHGFPRGLLNKEQPTPTVDNTKKHVNHNLLISGLKSRRIVNIVVKQRLDYFIWWILMLWRLPGGIGLAQGLSSRGVKRVQI